MATSYAGAVRNGSMAASRLHVELASKERMQAAGGSVDVFAASLAVGLPLLLRPLKGLLGAFLPEPIPGVLVTTERPLSIQRFTAAHELGHFRLKHLPSLDDESILRRMAMPTARDMDGPDFQEVEADAFAVGLLMPRWLIDWHCKQQGWVARDLRSPFVLYQLSLRLGTSFEAIAWTLQRLNLVSPGDADALRAQKRRDIKVELLKGYEPENYRGDVWVLTERDANTQIDGSRNDHFILRLHEHSGGGYLWNIDELKASGFAIVRDTSEIDDQDAVGSNTTRSVTAVLQQPQRGALSLAEARPWEPDAPISQLNFRYDFTGPEEEGLSRVERRHILQAA